MIHEIKNYIDDQTGNIVETITPISALCPAGFKGKYVVNVKINDKPHNPMMIDFPINAPNLSEAFAKFDELRDQEIKERNADFTKQQLSGGPKIELFI
jgi:hypothetical protein